ncbi:MAG: hypothetical protein ACTHQQ_02475 [Solirubrobacteraceae bacterium]
MSVGSVERHLDPSTFLGQLVELIERWDVRTNARCVNWTWVGTQATLKSPWLLGLAIK